MERACWSLLEKQVNAATGLNGFAYGMADTVARLRCIRRTARDVSTAYPDNKSGATAVMAVETKRTANKMWRIEWRDENPPFSLQKTRMR